MIQPVIQDGQPHEDCPTHVVSRYARIDFQLQHLGYRSDSIAVSLSDHGTRQFSNEMLLLQILLLLQL